MKKVTWVCKRKIRLANNKLGLEFQLTDQGQLLGEPLPFAISKNNRRLKIGCVYELEASETEARFSTAVFVREWQNTDDRLKWECESERAEQIERANKMQKEVEPALAESLDPLRKIYNRTDSLGKRAIESMVLSYLRA